MKIFVQVLDEGYTLTVTTLEQEVNREGQEILMEAKKKYAFETKLALTQKLLELGVIGAVERAA